MVDARGPADALGLVGATIDQVRFDACVDAGGFGLIYRGYHQGLGETVAIKCLRIAAIQKTNAAMREALAGRFRDEVKLLYRLSQGNLDIVRCIGSGTLIGGPVLGWLADTVGGRAPIILGGIVCLMAATFGYLASRHYTRRAHAAS